MIDIGFMISTSPESEDAHTLYQLAREALEAGKTVAIFMMCDGNYLSRDERFAALADAGAKLYLCAMNSLKRKIESVDKVIPGSQYDLAQIVADCRKFIAFN